MDKSLEARAERMVRLEVRACVSSLVSTLAAGFGTTFNPDHYLGEKTTDLYSLFDQAFELCSPVLDYEEAARQAGWKTADMTLGMLVNDSILDDDGNAFDAEGWQEACELSGVGPYEREIFEHWIVSDWLAEKLEAEGERVDRDFAGLCVWGRTTTGQAIAMDDVIQRITARMFSPEAVR